MKNKVSGKIVVGGFIFIICLILALALHPAYEQETSAFMDIELKEVQHDACFSPNNDGQKDTMQMKAYFTGKPHKRVYAFLFVKKGFHFERLLAGTSQFSNKLIPGIQFVRFPFPGILPYIFPFFI